MEFPKLPAEISSLVSLLNKANDASDVTKVVEPYKEYETKLRQIFAQQPQHPKVKENNLVSVFKTEQLLTKARNVETETDEEKEKYLLALSDHRRRQQGSPATVNGIKDFRTNFNLFSEQALADINWQNVVAAGSSVVTALLPIDPPHNESKRALRSYYHEQLAPASDVDLFIYGLDEEQALQKIKEIEASVRDSVLAETTTIRTKNAITIVSEYPTRHIQIVLRLYKSITEVLTGFDVDCSCVAYDGKDVWASPRALAAFATQQNSIDLTRRSPSYENRLSKYSHRGFEVYWPFIDRSRIDPTIYERAFNRVVGLARLLVLEKLPHPSDRDTYSDKRRQERGRPELPWNARYRHALPGNVKDAQPDDVPDWLEGEDVSDYHTFTIPYGPKYTAKRIEKLLFKQDLLLNAEWNRPKDRETNLHRHPAFFGSVDDVVQDCCGFCPEPKTDEDLKAYEEESKKYISGELHFIEDNPGRQAIGSFHPLTADDWTDMAYVGSSTVLCQAIVDNDLEAVKDWFGTDDANVDRRDHTGRTPLQLACMCSTPEIVQVLVDHGARIVSRIYNGMTALHMAAHRGNAEIVALLLDRSEANQEEEDRKEGVRKEARRAALNQPTPELQMSGTDDKATNSEDDDIEMVDDDAESNEDGEMTEGSFVKVKDEQKGDDDNENNPDVYDVDVLAWDSPLSALHLAIMGGHIEVIELLVQKYSADVMLPVKLKQAHYGSSTILNLVLPLGLPGEQAQKTVSTLLALGASPAQADADQISNLHYLVREMKLQIVDLLDEKCTDATRKVVNHLVISGWEHNPNFETPLLTAIRSGSHELVRKLLHLGAKPTIEFEPFAKAYVRKFENAEKDPDVLMSKLRFGVEQPIIVAAGNHLLVDTIGELLEAGADVNTMSSGAHRLVEDNNGWSNSNPATLLDIVKERVQKLKEYGPVKGKGPDKPQPLPEYAGSNAGAYESWILRTSYAQAKAIHEEQMKKYEEDLKDHHGKPVQGEQEKTEAISDMLKKWQALERHIVDQGGKTLDELHPDIKKDRDNRNNNYSYSFSPGRSNQNKDRPFENKLTFQVADLTATKREQYIKLFEAVYSGDDDTIKSMCLSKDKPLEIAIQDNAGFNPFSLALLRGHYKLARAVLDIAAVQFQPRSDMEQDYKYHIRRPEVDEDDVYDDEDGSSVENDDDLKFYKELVDEKNTIDDLRVLSENIKSRTSPAALFSQGCEVWRAVTKDERSAKEMFYPAGKQRHFSPYHDDEKTPWGWFHEMFGREKWRNSISLQRYAIVTKNPEMLKFLLGLQTDLLYKPESEGDSFQPLQLDQRDFELALQLGHTEMVGEIIRHTGVMLPIANLAQKTGVQIDEKPRYYQGLSVYGKKREDWARQERGSPAPNAFNHGSPLLAAIISGNITSVEYFLSDTPLRCYEEFTRTFHEDKRIQLLARAEGGIERALHSWMDTRTNLALHMAVMADPKTALPILDFLVKKLPQYLDSKSSSGDTPLQLAFQLRRYDAAKALIGFGADQKTRNKKRYNLLHTIYTSFRQPFDKADFDKAISLLNADLIPSLVVQRCVGDGPEAGTPLMTLLRSNALGDTENDMAVLEHLLVVSGDTDLEVMDGAGDYPLHALVRYTQHSHVKAKFIATRKPGLVFKENATGMTPLEIAENALLTTKLSSPPTVNLNYNQTQTYSITDIQPERFYNSTWNTSSGTYYDSRTYDALRQIADAQPRKRDLISLLDANETARRLAEQQSRMNEDLKRREAQGLKSYSSRRMRWMRDSEQNVQDEVSMWIGKV